MRCHLRTSAQQGLSYVSLWFMINSHGALTAVGVQDELARGANALNCIVRPANLFDYRVHVPTISDNSSHISCRKWDVIGWEWKAKRMYFWISYIFYFFYQSFCLWIGPNTMFSSCIIVYLGIREGFSFENVFKKNNKSRAKNKQEKSTVTMSPSDVVKPVVSIICIIFLSSQTQCQTIWRALGLMTPAVFQGSLYPPCLSVAVRVHLIIML